MYTIEQFLQKQQEIGNEAHQSVQEQEFTRMLFKDIPDGEEIFDMFN